MRAEARKYVIVETTGSFIVNAILNFLPAYAIFRNHPIVAIQGKGGMFQDSIGETLIVIFLSYLVPVLIGRNRRKAGTLPDSGVHDKPAGTAWLRALGIAVLCTVVLTALNALLLPKVFGTSVSLWTEVWFKTIYGAVIGSFASYLAIERTLREAEALPSVR